MKKNLTLFLILFIAGLSFGQTVNFSYTPTCYGSQTTLVGTSSLLDSDIQSWQWDIDNNAIFELSGKTIIYLFTNTDSIPVTIKITPNTGPDVTFTKKVFIAPLPNVNFQVNNLCAYKQATFYNQSTIATGAINQFLWDFNNDGIIDDNSGSIVNYTCGPPQSFITKLTCVSDKGCSAFATKSTIVYPQPSASFTYLNTCEDQNTLFTNTSTISSPDFFLWNFGDGEASAVNSPGHVYSFSGIYTVELIASTTNNCRDTAQMNIAVMPKPAISISASNNDTVLNGNGEQITLNTIGGTTNFLWSNGSNSPNISVYSPGTYSVTITDSYGCQNSASIQIISSSDEDSELVSTIITPNGDGINDKLEIKNLSNNIKLEIFNMWNDKVYSTDNYNNDWNCVGANGNILPDGAYYYIIMGMGDTKRGTINILTNK